jgi:hypothetical protein
LVPKVWVADDDSLFEYRKELLMWVSRNVEERERSSEKDDVRVIFNAVRLSETDMVTSLEVVRVGEMWSEGEMYSIVSEMRGRVSDSVGVTTV